MTDQMNWGGNIRYGATRIEEPTTIEAARRIVAESPRVRPLGTRHSFNQLPDGPEVLLHLGRLPADPVLDLDAMTVTVSAGTRFGVAAEFLESNGYALHNMGSLPHISIAGATATGTHGSGDRNRNLSAAVSRLQLIAPAGDLIDVDRSHPDFAGMVVALGALGPVTRVTLDIQPTYQVQQAAYANLPWDAALDHFDDITKAGYSVSLMTKWGLPFVERVWVKTRLDETEARPSVTDYGAARLDVAQLGHPASMTDFGTPGAWSLRLPHFRLDSTPSMGEEIQVEWMVPRPAIRTLLRNLQQHSHQIDPVLAVTEIRTMAGDDQWLSPAYGTDMVGVHFTLYRDPAAVEQLLHTIEPIFLAADARPHWGKLFRATSEDLADRYPRMLEWRQLRQRMDPDGKFNNAFLTQHVGL